MEAAPSMSDYLDVDSPIPYVLTDKARRELQQWRDEENFPACPHEWKFRNGRMICVNCELIKSLQPIRRIPSYLGPKSDWKRS